MDLRKIIYLFLLLLPLLVNGQEMEVEAINAMPFDLTASTNKRLDNNGNACALLKVVLPIQDVTFEGNVIGDVKYDAGEYRVYLPTGSKNLRIKHPQKRPLMVSFDDLGIRIEGGQTYQLTVKTEAGTESVTFKISPKDAILTVDQKEYPTDNGIAILSLTPDEHNYTIFAPGYQTQGNKFMVFTGQTNKLIIELDPKGGDSDQNYTLSNKDTQATLQGNTQSCKTDTLDNNVNESSETRNNQLNHIRGIETTLGCKFKTLEQEDMKSLKNKQGLKITDIIQGPLKEAGLKNGYIVQEINGQAIISFDDLITTYDKLQNETVHSRKVMIFKGVTPNGRMGFYAVALP